MPELPSRHDARNEDETIQPPRCGQCTQPFVRTGRQRSCSAACRQAAWRRRQPDRLPVLPATMPKATVVYVCGVCDTRYLGAQWCPECQRPCRRLGPGGACPHCDEPVALADLLPAFPTLTSRR